MRRIAFVAAVTVAFALALTPGARAGIADSPLPVLLAGATTYHVYSVPGVMSGAGAFTETFFSCSSLETTATIQIGVEVFDSFGSADNDPVATSLSMSPGRTVVFSTGPPIIGGLAANVYLNIFSSTHHSARILATSKKIMCTAFVADPNTLPPTSMSYLPIIAKTKQKAAN